MKHIRLSSTSPGTKEQRAARLKSAQDAAEESRKRIAALEANLSPEAKAQWNEMCGRGKSDPMLEGWKRERTLIEAMMSGEVLPSSSWSPAGFKQRLEELSECIRVAEEHKRAEQDRKADKREVEMLNREQERVSFFLRLLYKFTADEWVHKDIEEKTRALAEEWQGWQDSWQEYDRYNPNSGDKIGTGRAPSSFAEIAEHIRHNLSVYNAMISGYAKRSPVNNASLASQERCAALEAKQKTMEKQAALAIDAAREQGRREKQSEMDIAKARTRAKMHTSR